MDVAGFLAQTETYIHNSPWLAFGAVFVGGVVTACTPCIAAVFPLLMGIIGGSEKLRTPWRSFLFSMIFVAGLSTTFTIMGVAAVFMGQIFGDIGGYWPWVIALVCILMGAHMWGLWTIPVPEALKQYRPKHGGYLGAFVLGMLFGLVSAPCAAPVLVVLLTYIASEANLTYGLALLWTYAVGHCLLLVAAGTFMGTASKLFQTERYKRFNAILKKTAGLAIALAGVYILIQFQG